ncbi:MAG TPA: hypothetical protein VEF34_04790 [Syntrophobacteraceae bacterium]|nr:hypothetical protein [Syntrophobacteraceae bacterium]
MSDFIETNQKQALRNSRKVLVVANKGLFSENLVNHSVQLTGRLGYDLVALSVDTHYEGAKFEKRAVESAGKLCERAVSNGIHCSGMLRGGDIGFAVEEAIHEIKRVEIVVMDSEIKSESIKNISVPVISVLSASNNKGGNLMPAQRESSKAGAIGKTAGYGLLSAVGLAAVFAHAGTVAQVFSRGGWYAALPIATVLVFSFVHGAFAHNLWSLLGIEALKRDQVRRSEHKVIQKRKQQRRRPRAYAYVNPFHRMDV